MFCADFGHVPALLISGSLPGDFFGIVMEFVESSVPISHLDMFKKTVSG